MILGGGVVEDDAAQSRRIAERLRLAARRVETIFVPMTVMLELEWVLRSRYAFAKTDVLLAMNALLETRELEFQAEPAVERSEEHKSELPELMRNSYALHCSNKIIKY